MLDALIAGLSPLAYWGTWLVMGAHLVVCVGVLLLGGAMMGGDEPPERGAGRWTAGCLIGTIGHIVAVGATTGIAVGLLVPVLFGQERLTEPGLLMDNAWQLVKYGLGGVLMSFLIALIPIVGGLAAESPGFTVYITSICVFRGLLRPLLENEAIDDDAAFPGFWTAVCFGLIVAVLLFAIKWATAALAAATWRNERVAARVRSIVIVLALACGVLAGFVPFFMYAASTYANVRKESARLDGVASTGFQNFSEAFEFVERRVRQDQELSEAELESVIDAVRQDLHDGKLTNENVQALMSGLRKVPDLLCAHWECVAASRAQRRIVRTGEYERLRADVGEKMAPQLKEFDAQLADAADGRAYATGPDGERHELGPDQLNAVLARARRSRAVWASVTDGIDRALLQR